MYSVESPRQDTAHETASDTSMSLMFVHVCVIDKVLKVCRIKCCVTFFFFWIASDARSLLEMGFLNNK